MPPRPDTSPLPPSSSAFSQSTPALSHRLPGHSASSSSPPNDLIATPSDRYDVSRGTKLGKQPQRRSVRIRTSSGGNPDSSPQVVNLGGSASYLDVSDPAPLHEVPTRSRAVRTSSNPALPPSHASSSTSRVRMPRASLPPRAAATQAGSSDTLALAQAHGITADQFEEAKQQVMRFLRTENAPAHHHHAAPTPISLAAHDDSAKRHAHVKRLSNSMSFPGASISTAASSISPVLGHATTPVSASFHISPVHAPYPQAPLARTPNASSALQRATFESVANLDLMDAGRNSTKSIRARPSFEDVVQRSAKRQVRDGDASMSHMQKWAQDESSSSSEEEGPGLASMLSLSAHSRKISNTPGGSRLLPSPASFGGQAVLDANTSPSLNQGGAQRRGMMDRFMSDRPNLTAGDVAASQPNVAGPAARSQEQKSPVFDPRTASPPRRATYAQHALLTSPAPSKPSQSVLFSPDVAKLLRSELDELEANEMAGARKPSSPLKNVDRSSDIVVDEASSSPYGPGSPFSSAGASRTRDIFSVSHDKSATRRAGWADPPSANNRGLVSPTMSAASLSMRAPSFCDSSPAASEHGSVTSRSQPYISSSSSAHPASAPDFLYGGVPSSSPTSSHHSEYPPTRFHRSSPGPFTSTSSLSRSDSSSTSAVASSSRAKRGPAHRADSLPYAAGQQDPHVKPTWSYAALIGQAIFSTEERKISLADIYAFIMRSYPYYKKEDAGWQNSIRHNLSLNECFIKTARGPDNPGKGCLWAIAAGCEDQFVDGGFVKKGGSGTSRRNRGKAAQAAAKFDPQGLLRVQAPTSATKRGRASSPAGSVSSRGGTPAPTRIAPQSQQVMPHQQMPPQLQMPHQQLLPQQQMPPPRPYSPTVSVRSATPASMSPPSNPPPTFDFSVPPPALVPRPASSASVHRVERPLPPSRPATAMSARSYSLIDFSEEHVDKKHRLEAPPVVRTLSAPVLNTSSAPVAMSTPAPAAPVSPLPSRTAAPVSPPPSRTTGSHLREPILSTTMSPPTSVYHRLAGPYQPLSYGNSSVQNHRALALLASPEAAGIMPAVHPFDRSASLLTAAAQGSPRSSSTPFLPAPHIFPGSNSKRQRTESDKEDRTLSSLLSPSTLVHTQSPISSIRGGPRAPMSPVQPSSDKLEPQPDPKKRATGTRLLPAVNALVDAAHDPFRSPPRAHRRSPSARSLTSLGPLQAALQTPGGKGRPLGFSPSLAGGNWSSWNDPYGGGVEAELEHFGRNDSVHGSGVSGTARLCWPSPGVGHIAW
ncbi:hypothetical protein JCM1841_005178 [Sporobolomyces salmonicolor]